MIKYYSSDMIIAYHNYHTWQLTIMIYYQIRLIISLMTISTIETAVIFKQNNSEIDNDKAVYKTGNAWYVTLSKLIQFWNIEVRGVFMCR